MKKEYMKPSVEVEVYSLSSSIAANCNIVISLGPEDFVLGKNGCEDFPGDGAFGKIGDFASPMGGVTSFYESGYGATKCDCYYTASGNSYFTS